MATIIVVKERGVEPDAVEVRRPTPGTTDVRRRYKEVVHIEVVGSCAADEGIRQIEQAFRAAEGQARSPYPLMGGQTAKVVLSHFQTVTDQRPACEIG